MSQFRYEELSLDKIDVSELNVRKSEVEEGLDELAKSIEEIGLQQPIVVYQVGNRYKLIIGQRRYLAFKKLGREKIPALVTRIENEMQATIASFSENIHRLDLKYRDKMAVSTELLNKLGTVDRVAKQLGISPQTVRNYLGYAVVPEPIKKMVDKKDLSASTAVRISKNISDESLAVRIAEKIKEVPRSEDRRSLIDTAKENPREPVSEISRLAKKRKFRKITINLTLRVAEALEKACEQTGTEKEDIAIEAVEVWLKAMGFLE